MENSFAWKCDKMDLLSPDGPWVSWSDKLRAEWTDIVIRFENGKPITDIELQWLKAYLKMWMDPEKRPTGWEIKLELITSPAQLRDFLNEEIRKS